MGSSVLRVGTGYNLIPRTFACSINTLVRTSECRKPGITAEILGYVLDQLSVNYTLVNLYSLNLTQLATKYFSDPNRSITLVDMIHMNLADTVAAGMLISPAGLESFDYSFPMFSEQLVFLVKKPQLSFEESALTTLRILTPKLWLSFLGVVCVIFGCMLLLQKVSKLLIIRSRSPRSLTPWDIFAFVLDQGPIALQKSHASNILILCLGLLVILVLGIYQGVLLTRLLRPPVPPAFKSADEMMDLVKAGEYKFLRQGPFFWYWREMAVSQTPYYKRLRNSVKNNAVVTIRNGTEALRMLHHENYIYPTSNLFAEYILRDHCDLTAIPNKELLPKWNAFIFKKNSSWTSKFHEALVLAQPHNRHILARYTGISTKCATEKSTQSTTLSIETLLGAFALYCLGTVASITWLVAERLTSRNTPISKLAKVKSQIRKRSRKPYEIVRF